jgi:hypothetical protein
MPEPALGIMGPRAMPKNETLYIYIYIYEKMY